MINKEQTIQTINTIVGSRPPMEVQLQVIIIDLLFEIRDELRRKKE